MVLNDLNTQLLSRLVSACIIIYIYIYIIIILYIYIYICYVCVSALNW